MAEKKGVQEKTEIRTEEKAKVVRGKEVEAVYSFDELVASASMFHTKKECVAAALKRAGKKAATIKETELLVKNFLYKEVL